MSSVINLLVTSIQTNAVFACIVLAFIVIALFISLAVIFHKIGQKFWKALIPLYNIIKLLSILNIPIWMVLLMLIPFVNIIGIPFMMLLIGWRLGSICHKNILIKIGLSLCPILFFPLLAASRIDLTGKYEKMVVVPVVEKKEFSLEPVIMNTNVDVQPAMNLSETETLEKITVKVKKEKPIIEKKEIYNEDKLTEHLSKANKEMPTAQDLTFNYNIIYATKNEELQTNTIENENPTFQALEQAGMVTINETDKTENNSVDYNTVYVEPVEEPIFPKIYEIELEEASPIDESTVGPIPINQRYDKQRKKENNKEPTKIEEPILSTVEQPNIIPVDIPQVIPDAPVIGNLNMASPPIVNQSISAMMAPAPDFSNQTANIEQVDITDNIIQLNIVDTPTIQVENIVSMNIEEPDTLPVGILKKENNGKLEEVPVLPPEEISQPVQQYITEQPINNVPDLLPNPTMIFQTEMGAEPILRPVQPVAVEAQLDKVCPRCSVKLKRDCPVCIMCGYKF